LNFRERAADDTVGASRSEIPNGVLRYGHGIIARQVVRKEPVQGWELSPGVEEEYYGEKLAWDLPAGIRGYLARRWR